MRPLTLNEIIAVVIIFFVGMLLPMLMRKLSHPTVLQFWEKDYSQMDANYGVNNKIEAILFLIGFLPPVLITLYVKIGWWIGLGFGLGILLPSLMHIFHAMRVGSVKEFFRYLELKNNVRKQYIILFYSLFIIVGLISSIMLYLIY